MDSSVCSDVHHVAFRPVFSTFTMLLVDKDFQLNLKVTIKSSKNCEVFNISIYTVEYKYISSTRLSSFFCCWLFQSQALLVLPFFTSLPEEFLAELQRALDTLVVSHFPIQSDEFAKGSLRRNNYMDCIRKVNCFENIGGCHKLRIAA